MIEVEHLTKYYGDFPAVVDLSFQVKKGEILGFLGPNGSGKTTTMRILTGFMPPTSGKARIAGYDVLDQSLDARRQIGYLPETVPLYSDMTIEGYLDYMGALRAVERKRRKRRIGEVIDICRLGEYRHRLIGKLSKGFRQRVGIAQAILHEPQVLVMDEPTIGIDPIQVVETRQLIKSLGGDHTVIISTHILPEVSMVCERVIIIHEGQLVAVDKPENLSKRLQTSQHLSLEVRGPTAEVMKTVRGLKGIQDIAFKENTDYVTYTLEGRPGEDLRELLAKTVVDHGWALLKLEAVSLSLEEIFLRLTTQEQEHPGHV